MTHKQKHAQLYSTPRPSVDAVDNAADLYRQFDEELGQLLEEEDVLFDIDESDADGDAVATSDTQTMTAADVSDENADVTGDIGAYVKDDSLNIRFQGENKAPAPRIGTRQYSDTSRSRDEALAAYQAMIRKEEALARIAQQPRRQSQGTDAAVRSTLVREAARAAQRDAAPHAPAEGAAQEVRDDADAVDLDTGRTLGGRAALMAELARTTPQHESDMRPTSSSARKPDVVRLGAVHGVPHSRKERPQTDASPQRDVALAYRRAQHTSQQRTAAERAQRAKSVVPRPPVQRAQRQVSPQSPQPAVYQLGRPVNERQHDTPSVIMSQYVPQQTPSVIDPATPRGAREGIVAFFDKKRTQSTPRADGRAHASLGSQTFDGTSPKRSFAEVAQRVRDNRTDEDAADFLDEGTITFVEPTPKARPKPAVTPKPKEEESAVPRKSASPSGAHTTVQRAPSPATVVHAPRVTATPQEPPRAQAGAAQQQLRVNSRSAPPMPTPTVAPEDAQRIKEELARQARKRLQQTPPSVVKKKSVPVASRAPKTSSVPAQRNVPAQQAKSHAASRNVRTASRVSQSPPAQPSQRRTKPPTAHAPQPPHKSQQSSARRTHRRAPRRSSTTPSTRRSATLAVTAVITLALVLFGGALVRHGATLYTSVTNAAMHGFESLQAAVRDAKRQDFVGAQQSFQKAAADLGRADASFARINSGMIAITQYIPFLSKVASGKNAIAAGEHIARAGVALSQAGQILKGVSDSLAEDASLLTIYRAFAAHVHTAHAELQAADDALANVSAHDIPAAQRTQFVALKEKLPVVLAALDQFQQNSDIIADLLGANGPRKYLFLFQNNHEMRATGGFIGSYGRLDISNGRITKFFIDGIFNPDGQLTEKIIPPRPIQKISAAWSLHDSNWFPDFPTSAEEAIVFYERTGGPTVDGVIAITPVVLQHLLETTGPVHLPEYETDITAENFMERLQYEVEVDYDKGENKPKKILSDLAPILLERVFAMTHGGDLQNMLNLLGKMLVQKHIQIYARNPEVEKLIDAAGWSGKIADVSYDYLSVINTNINGYKTDGVVDETIYHWADIKDDGSIVDTVRIVRKHTGGRTPYEWWNKVNANYMRVYVPRGSQLLSVSGQTREFVEPPLDYQALGFQSDPRVVQEEQSMTIDDATGTRIYEQHGKTVFANWVYVSPQETVTVEYTYRLPFRVRIDGPESADTYSILFQKQPGSVGSRLVSEITVPTRMRYVWSYPEGMGVARWETRLTTDTLRGVVLAPADSGQ